MKQYNFKTNINCGGCVAAVTPFLNAHTGIKQWQVDTQNSNKMLTVQTETLNADDIKAIVAKAGFKAEII